MTARPPSSETTVATPHATSSASAAADPAGSNSNVALTVTRETIARREQHC